MAVDKPIEVVVIPEPGQLRELAKALLLAADNPGQVRMVTYPKAGFVVPVDVFERFEGIEPETQATEATDTPVDKPVETGAPRKRGRPRKTPAPVQDNKSEKEE